MIWLAVAVVAVLIALDKSFLPGAAMFGVGMLASVAPAKQASGTTLALLIVADWVAIWAYRKDVDWHTLRRLLPNVVVGVVLGAGFLFVASDEATKRLIGAILLVFILVNLAVMLGRRRRARVVEPVAVRVPADEGAPPGLDVLGPPPDGRSSNAADAGASHRGATAKRAGYGALAGFTTMVANAGGPVTSLYFMSEGFPVIRFLGTTAWFYLVINLVKLPFSLGLGMIDRATLGQVVVMVPVIVLTVLAGRWLAKRVERRAFNVIVIVLTLVTAVELLL